MHWNLYNRLCAQGEYVELNFYPNNDSVLCQQLHTLIQDRLQAMWTSWYGGDLDMSMTVLALLSPRCLGVHKKQRQLVRPPYLPFEVCSPTD